MTFNQDFCPHCNENLQGSEIPKDQQHLFGSTHFSLKIGVYDSSTDRTTHYSCPFCKQIWERKNF